MSRTDAHAPHWVSCELYEPAHRCVNAIHTHWSAVGYPGECDLPDTPVRRRPVLSGWRWRPESPRCTWQPTWDGVSAWPRPPRWFVEHHWHNPERRRVRDTLLAAVADWRANGGTDVEPAPRQARHGAAYYWS